MTTTYQHALEVAESLSHADRLRLIRELQAKSAEGEESASILDLEGLGADLWQGIDAQEYVRQDELQTPG